MSWCRYVTCRYVAGTALLNRRSRERGKSDKESMSSAVHCRFSISNTQTVMSKNASHLKAAKNTYVPFITPKGWRFEPILFKFMSTRTVNTSDVMLTSQKYFLQQSLTNIACIVFFILYANSLLSTENESPPNMAHAFLLLCLRTPSQGFIEASKLGGKERYLPFLRTASCKGSKY